MIEAEDISIHAIDTPEGASPFCELLLCGNPTGITLPGAVFEAALRVGGYLVVFTTDDCPFEESLNVILLNNSLEVLENVSLWAWYSTGSFLLQTAKTDQSIFFRFMGDWRVEILPKDSFYLPYISDPVCVQRKLTFFRRLKFTSIN